MSSLHRVILVSFSFAVLIATLVLDDDRLLAGQAEGSGHGGSAEAAGRFSMSRAVVCDTIDGFENYRALKGAALTSDEKLLVYFRPLNFKIESKDGEFRAHLTEDAVIRKKGEKKILRQKEKMIEYLARSATPPRSLYMRTSISLKGLEPGEYDLTLILHDEFSRGATSQVVRFKVVPATIQKKPEATSEDGSRDYMEPASDRGTP